VQPADAAAAAEAIRQAALRYCRGVDRLDAELMRSAACRMASAAAAASAGCT